ncbi:MAG: DegT/DnrJ/EryC1/StrS family aminotransferase [Defluviitaleaceae bacterium]|nr:DegT/DnrJ/EryC1/StrS family aminotransferase [Defluviitaleaceae bacterium]
MSELLALYGGPKSKTTPFATGKRFTSEEVNEVTELLQGNSLFYRNGGKTAKMEERMCELYCMQYAVACSSGTAAVHIAVAALGIGPGDEVLMPAITDMGSIIGVLYQGAIPIFLDMDQDTFNFDINDLEKKITPKTKAIMVVHYMGNPCNMDAIMDMAGKHNLYVIEDCAQSPHARHKGKLVGTMGHIGCFSFNDIKHVSTGDGGICITNDANLAGQMRMYTDKAYCRKTPVVKFSEFLAPNYRISDLCSAVGYAQLGKLDALTKRRHYIAQAINKTMESIDGLNPMQVSEGSFCSYWFYLARLEEDEIGVSRNEFVEAMNGEGIPVNGSHTPTPVYDYGVFKNLNAFPGTGYPFVSKDFDSNYSYKNTDCPNAQPLLDKTVIIRINEFFSDQDIADICKALEKVAKYYRKGK